MSRTNFFRAASEEFDGVAKAAAAAALGVLVVQWGFIMAFLVPRFGTMSYLRLHYTAERGVDWVGAWPLIFTFPVLGLVFWFMNVAFAAMLAGASAHLARLILIVTVGIELALAAGGVFAVLLNG